MNLRDALQQAEFARLDDKQALEYGNETVVIGGSGATRWTYAGVADQFGVAAAEGLLAAIQGAGLPGAAATYISPGITLSLPVVQEQLNLISKLVPDLSSLCSALKEIGITHGTRWAGLGVEQPTVEQITAARVALASSEWWAQVANETVPPLLSSGADKATIKAAIAAQE